MNKVSFWVNRGALTAAFLLSLFPLQGSTAEKGENPVAETARQSLSEVEPTLVTGQVITVAGHTFFQHFIAHWRDQPRSEHFSLTVHERPSALRGSQIRIDSGNRTVFAATLPNSRSDLKNFAERAVEIAYQKASEAEIQQLLFRDADLGPGDF